MVIFRTFPGFLKFKKETISNSFSGSLFSSGKGVTFAHLMVYQSDKLSYESYWEQIILNKFNGSNIPAWTNKRLTGPNMCAVQLLQIKMSVNLKRDEKLSGLGSTVVGSQGGEFLMASQPQQLQMWNSTTAIAAHPSVILGACNVAKVRTGAVGL